MYCENLFIVIPKSEKSEINNIDFALIHKHLTLNKLGRLLQV